MFVLGVISLTTSSQATAAYRDIAYDSLNEYRHPPPHCGNRETVLAVADLILLRCEAISATRGDIVLQFRPA